MNVIDVFLYEFTDISLSTIIDALEEKGGDSLIRIIYGGIGMLRQLLAFLYLILHHNLGDVTTKDIIIAKAAGGILKY